VDGSGAVVVAADEVEHDIDVAGLALEPGGGVVDDLASAELAQELFAGGGGGDDRSASRNGDLNDQVPDASGGGVDENALPGGDLGGVDQGSPGRQPGQDKAAAAMCPSLVGVW
jgi:hypothetical protein